MDIDELHKLFICLVLFHYQHVLESIAIDEG